jgi:hypothetical protein
MNLDALTPMLSEPRQVPTEGKVTYHEPMIEREPREGVAL